jgi:hypothetical protein
MSNYERATHQFAKFVFERVIYGSRTDDILTTWRAILACWGLTK